VLAEECEGLRPGRGDEDVKALRGQGHPDEFTGELIIVHHQDRPAIRHLAHSRTLCGPVGAVARHSNQ
jgi:hypothetical protein